MHAVDTSPEAVCPFENCEQVVYDDYLKKLKHHRAFICYDVKERMEYLSSLVITPSRLHLMRMMPRKKGYAYVVYSKLLNEISMITAKTNYPEVITITFGNPTSDEPGASSSDRFFIPDAEAAVCILKGMLERWKKIAMKIQEAKCPKGKTEKSDDATTTNSETTTDDSAKVSTKQDSFQSGGDSEGANSKISMENSDDAGKSAENVAKLEKSSTDNSGSETAKAIPCDEQMEKPNDSVKISADVSDTSVKEPSSGASSEVLDETSSKSQEPHVEVVNKSSADSKMTELESGGGMCDTTAGNLNDTERKE